MNHASGSLTRRDGTDSLGRATGGYRSGEQRAASLRAGSALVTDEPSAGLPASGAVALALGAGIGGAAVDVATGGSLRLIFAVAFVTGCVLAAVLVRRRSLAAAVVLPPLAYTVVALGAGLYEGDTGTSSWLMQAVFELLDALITGAPVLLAATAAAAAVAGVRLLLDHEPIRPHLPRSG